MEERGAGGGGLRVDLSDGSSFFVHREVAARRGLSRGAALSAEDVAALVEESESMRARERGFSLLARAAHSRRGLERKLLRKGFPPQAVQSAVARIAELGYLDDRAFAEAWVRSRLASRREGWKAVYRGLLRQGVERQAAAEAVDGQYPEEMEWERAMELASPLTPRKAASCLSARGFRTRAIAKVIREMGRTGPGWEAG